MNLSYEVRMGIVGHTGPRIPETLEGQVVRHSDRIAYVNHDIDDAIRAGILTNDDIPDSITNVLGHNHSQRIDTLVCDMILTSREAGEILLSPKVDEALKDCEKPITVAVMGCVVNGPGEAREADIGIAGGDGWGMIFEKGEQVEKLPFEELLPALLRRIEKL